MSFFGSTRGAASSGGHLWLLTAAVGTALAAWLLFGESEPTTSAGASTDGAPAPSPTLDDDAPRRPTTPPVRGRDEPPRRTGPVAPPNAGEVRAQAYADAVKGGDSHPAETAFRAAVSAFVEHNRQLADRQAQKEGLTLEEVKELTYFGMMAQQTQRWPEVEEVLGQPLDDAARTAGEQMLQELNQEFKAAMRALVKGGATADERWRLIRATEARYKEAYFATTGMTEALLQDLLAGDLNRKYPMSQTPPPEQLAEQAEVPPEPEPRPEAAPEGGPAPEDAPSPADSAPEAPTESGQ